MSHCFFLFFWIYRLLVSHLKQKMIKQYKVVSSLNDATIPDNVTVIEANAYRDCSSLKTVTIKAPNLTSIGAGAFEGINDKAIIKLSVNKKYKDNLKKLLCNHFWKSEVKQIIPEQAGGYRDRSSSLRSVPRSYRRSKPFHEQEPMS